jgi:hypothetical protein
VVTLLIVSAPSIGQKPRSFNRFSKSKTRDRQGTDRGA